MKKILLTSIITLLLLGANLFAERYTLDQLIEIGLSKSYDIQEAKVANKNYNSNLRSSLYGILPTATISTSSSENLDAANPDWYDTAGLSLSKTIALNEPTYFNIHSSILDMNNAEHSLDETKKQIAYKVFSKYLDVLKSQETLQIQRKNLELQQKIHQQIQVQFDAGDKSLLELKQSEVSLIDYEILVNEASNSLSKIRKGLFSYLNIEDEKLDFVEPELTISLQNNPFQTNNVLEQKKNFLKNSSLSLIQSGLGILPSITCAYSFAHNDNGDINTFSDYLRTNNSLSLSVTWDIFGIPNSFESFFKKKRNHKLMKLDLDISKRNYMIQLENLKNDMATYSRSYELYTEKLTLAEENLNMAQEQFKLGMISLLDLDRSKIDFQNAQLSHINSHYNLMKKHEEINLLLSEPILGKW